MSKKSSPSNLPLIGYHFKVDFIFPFPSKTMDARFQSVEGIGKKLKEANNDGSESSDSRLNSYPADVEYSKLTLSRGLIPGSYLIDWFDLSIAKKRIVPIPVVVSALDENHKPAQAWFFLNAYPIEWETKGFDAQKAGIITEKIVLNYSSYTQVDLAKIDSFYKDNKIKKA